jgi:hypothetical protein
VWFDRLTILSLPKEERAGVRGKVFIEMGVKSRRPGIQHKSALTPKIVRKIDNR